MGQDWFSVTESCWKMKRMKSRNHRNYRLTLTSQTLLMFPPTQLWHHILDKVMTFVYGNSGDRQKKPERPDAGLILVAAVNLCVEFEEKQAAFWTTVNKLSSKLSSSVTSRCFRGYFHCLNSSNRTSSVNSGDVSSCPLRLTIDSSSGPREVMRSSGRDLC